MKKKFLNRIKKLQKEIKTKNCDGVLVLSNSDVFYLSNFYSHNNDAILLITLKELYFLTDGRFINQFDEEVEGFKLIKINKTDIYENINKLIFNLKKVMIPYDNLSYKNFLKLKGNFIDSKNIISKLREVKDKNEIKYIKKACKISEDSFLNTLNFIKPGISEIDIKNILEEEMRKKGSKYPAFSTIIASGPINGSLPHAIPTDRKVKKGDLITIDFGATYKNYCSDITRTIAIGNISPKLENIYIKTLEAKKEAEKCLRKNNIIKEINNSAENVINSINQPFLHSIGHGIGIDIHEEPFLNKNNDNKLKEGNIHTIEPGIYIKNLGGVRIEDDYLIENNKIKCLTKKIPTDLIIL